MRGCWRLTGYVPGLSATGVYDEATARAFEQYGNRALYSRKQADENGKTYTSYGVVQSGNAVSPWQTEEQRRNANNTHLGRYGLSGEEVYPLYDSAGNTLDYGSMGHDGMGGVYDPEGYSSNPYFLMANVGVSRSQLTGVAAQASDKSIKMALELDPNLLGRDLYVTNGGGISSAYTPGSLSVNAIREEIAALRGLSSTKQLGMGTVAVEIPKPDYYVPATPSGTAYAGNGTSGTGDAFTQLYNTLASVSGSTAYLENAPTRDAFSYYYDRILDKLTSSMPIYTLPTYNESQLSAQYASYLRPQVDSAIAARKDASLSNRAELDADAAARGMGSSTFVSSLKNREMNSAASDISNMETEYLSILSERVQEGMMAQLKRQQELYMFQAEQQSLAQRTALSLASDWYMNYLDRQEALQLAQLKAGSSSSGRSSSKTKTGKEYSGKILTKAQYQQYVDSLSQRERELLMTDNSNYWSVRRNEIIFALGQAGYEEILNRSK